MKKITSVILALMLLVSLFAFTSCEAEPLELLEEASKALSEKPYTMTLKMDFDSDNAELNEAFALMNLEFPVTIDGENLSFGMSTEVFGQAMSTNMTLVDKVLYYDIQAGEILSQKMKVTLSEEELKEFLNQQSIDMPVDYSQFAELKSEKKDGKTVISCSGITDEGKKALNDQMAASLAALGGTAELGDISYAITISDGKFEAMELSCTYSVSMSGKSITATMKMVAAFDYEDVAAVTVPADADSYKAVNFSDLGSLIG